MKFIQLFILIMAFLIISPANAGLLLEPVAGYSFSKFDVDSEDFKSTKGRGASLGGRVGFQKLGFQLGLDYLRSNVRADHSSYKEDIVTSEYAGFVGFEFPVFLRVYAGYIFAASGSTKVDLGQGDGKENVEFSDGSGAKFGVGFTFLPLVDINVEYRRGTFGELKLAGDKKNDETSYNAIMVGVSLPFVI